MHYWKNYENTPPPSKVMTISSNMYKFSFDAFIQYCAKIVGTVYIFRSYAQVLHVKCKRWPRFHSWSFCTSSLPLPPPPSNVGVCMQHIHMTLHSALNIAIGERGCVKRNKCPNNIAHYCMKASYFNPINITQMVITFDESIVFSQFFQ